MRPLSDRYFIPVSIFLGCYPVEERRPSVADTGMAANNLSLDEGPFPCYQADHNTTCFSAIFQTRKKNRERQNHILYLYSSICLRTQRSRFSVPTWTFAKGKVIVSQVMQVIQHLNIFKMTWRLNIQDRCWQFRYFYAFVMNHSMNEWDLDVA